MNKKYERLCPICDTKITYSRKSGLTRAINKNRKCLSCSMKDRNVSESTRKIISENMSGYKNHRFNIQVSNLTRKKISVAGKGRKFSNSHKSKISISNTGKQHSEKTKEKLRNIRLQQIYNLGTTLHNYNPVACRFIDHLNISLGLKLQHALNGGEVIISGYLLDGYDKEKNIVFEYDEPPHHHPSRHSKDLIRQSRIINKISPILFLRYDEKNDILYDALTKSPLSVKF